jgi:hypothetical protein
MDLVYDIVVAGGGLSGTFAAVAAAREGARVALFEPSGFLGGNATAGMVTTFMQYHVAVGDETHALVRGLFEETVNRLTRDNMILATPFSFDDFALRCVLDDLVCEAGVEVFFHSLIVGASTQGERMASLSFAGKSGLQEARAKVFIDSTGDADLACYGGAKFHIGREGDGKSQPMTATFQMAGIDPDCLPASAERGRVYREAYERGDAEIDLAGVGMWPTPHKGVYFFNTLHVCGLSGIDTRELSRAEIEGRRLVRAISRDLVKNIPGFENAYLIKTGTKIGVRETRHLIGEYTITAEDVIGGRRFDDGIARCAYEIDIHSPDNKATRHVVLDKGVFYEIPYRCLLPLHGPRNVLIACRAISATHDAHASLRIMPTMSAIGEAAGIAAAQSLDLQNDVHAVDAAALKEMLLQRAILGDPPQDVSFQKNFC